MSASGSTLSESASKSLLRGFGVTIADEREVGTAHQTERGLVRLKLADAAAVEAAGNELLAKATPEDGPVSLLVAPMVAGNRELIAGVVRDPQFGANVMLGVGGILAEAIADVVFRPVPITEADADEMIDQLATQQLLGAFRGEAAID